MLEPTTQISQQPLLVSCGSGSILRGVGTVWWGPPKGAQDYCGYVCSALDMSDSTALHEDNCGVSGNTVGVAGSAVGGNAVLYPGVSGNTTGL